METYYGHVKSPSDAIILFEACRLGHLPRVQRRLSEKERQQIRSGSVFVWDEREAGMRRWTDGKSWSASRVSGSFLTYREMEGKRAGSTFNSPMQGMPTNGNGMERHRSGDSELGLGDGLDGYRYKPDGLMKQSFSITTSDGQHLHLISYHARSDPSSATLMQPANDPQLRSIRPEKGMYPETTMHDTPGVTRSPMTASPYGTSPRDRQPQNYLRHPPQQPGHAWPPSPLDTPPAYYSHQSPYTPNMAPPGSAGPSPMYFNRPYGNHGRQLGQTAFDRPPPPMSNGAMPLPPPQPSSSSYYHPPSASSYQSGQLPPITSGPLPPPTPTSNYPPSAPALSNYSPSLPSTSYPPSVPPSSNYPAAPSPSLSYPPPVSSSTYPAPQPSSSYSRPRPYPHQSPSSHRDSGTHYTAPLHGPTASSYGPPPALDPRLDGPAGIRQQMLPQNQSKYELPPPPPPPPAPQTLAAISPSSTTTNSNSSSQPPIGVSKTIPSIGSLINPTPAPAMPSPQMHHHYASNSVHDTNSRPHTNGVTPRIESVLDHSPQHQHQHQVSDHPQHSPTQQQPKASHVQRHADAGNLGSKMGFGEDSRLLRQLDRAFAA